MLVPKLAALLFSTRSIGVFNGATTVTHSLVELLLLLLLMLPLLLLLPPPPSPGMYVTCLLPASLATKLRRARVQCSSSATTPWSDTCTPEISLVKRCSGLHD